MGLVPPLQVASPASCHIVSLTVNTTLRVRFNMVNTRPTPLEQGENLPHLPVGMVIPVIGTQTIEQLECRSEEHWSAAVTTRPIITVPDGQLNSLWYRFPHQALG